MAENTMQPTPAIGRILIAKPFIMDALFKRAVMLVAEHSRNGTIGFILNKPSDFTINDALEDFPTFKVPLYFGGPVEMKTIHFIHTLGEKLEGSKRITDGIYWGGNLEVLKLMIETRQVKRDEVRFFSGYCGWEPYQLNQELRKETRWLISEGKKDFAFAKDPENTWGKVLKTIGSKYAALDNFIENPGLN